MFPQKNNKQKANGVKRQQQNLSFVTKKGFKRKTKNKV